MELISERSPHLQLSFHEANILMVNLRRQNKSGFLARLSNLSSHTTDPDLLLVIEGLKDKILELSEDEFTALREDTIGGQVMFPPNYSLPNFTE